MKITLIWDDKTIKYSSERHFEEENSQKPILADIFTKAEYEKYTSDSYYARVGLHWLSLSSKLFDEDIVYIDKYP